MSISWAKRRAQRGRDIDLDLDRQMRIAAVHLLDEVWQPCVDDRLGDAQSDDAANGRRVAKCGEHLGPHSDHLLGIAEHLPSARRRRDVARFARQELEAQFVLELRDPVRDHAAGWC